MRFLPAFLLAALIPTILFACVGSWDWIAFPSSASSDSSPILTERGLAPNFYTSTKAFDHDMNTAWCAQQTSGNPWIRIRLPDMPLCNFRIISGVAANRSLYKENNRVRDYRATVIYTDRTTQVFTGTLPDMDCMEIQGYCKNATGNEMIDNREHLTYDQCMRKYQNACFPPFLYLPSGPEIPGPAIAGREDGAVPVREMKFEILSVYRGTKYDDTCISEIIAVGTP